MNIMWTPLLLVDLLLPLVLILFGWIFVKYTPPYSKDALFGYRTKRSKINSDTWNFAHKHFGKTAMILGIIMIPLSILSFMPFMNGEITAIALVGVLILIIQTIIFIVAMLPTEKALKNTFDDYGFKR